MPEEKVLCLVCNNPSAIFHRREDGHMVRLAKSMTRVTGKKSPAMYVHTEPCLGALVANWAKYVAEGMKKTGLERLAEEQTNVTANEPYLQDP